MEWTGSVQLLETRRGEGERDGRREEGIEGEKESAGTAENEVIVSSKGRMLPLGMKLLQACNSVL